MALYSLIAPCRTELINLHCHIIHSHWLFFSLLRETLYCRATRKRSSSVASRKHTMVG